MQFKEAARNWTLILIMTSIPAGTIAATFPLPVSCRPDKALIKGQINGSSSLNAEFRFYLDPYEPQSQNFEIPSGPQEIPLSRFTDQITKIDLKIDGSNIPTLNLECPQDVTYPLRAFEDSKYYFNLSKSSTNSFTLKFMDLGHDWQKIKLEWKNIFGKTLAEESLEITDQRKVHSYKTTAPLGAKMLIVSGELRFAVWLFDSKNESVKALSKIEPTTVANKQLRYFLVAPRALNGKMDGESFTIAMQDPDSIRLALQLLQNPQQEKIIIAGIKKGARSYNRAWHQKTKSPYSWFVDRVDAFSDFAHISCDGSPEMIEENLDLRMEQGGRICFWRYRLIKELTLKEIETGNLD